MQRSFGPYSLYGFVAWPALYATPPPQLLIPPACVSLPPPSNPGAPTAMSAAPSMAPTMSTGAPSVAPTMVPTAMPTAGSRALDFGSTMPTSAPTGAPTFFPPSFTLPPGTTLPPVARDIAGSASLSSSNIVAFAATVGGLFAAFAAARN